MNRSWKFFAVFFFAHLAVSVTHFFLSGQPGSESPGAGGGRVGIPMFGVVQFLLTGGRPMATTVVSPLFFILNSAVTAGVATGIFLVIRRLRSA
jgi:hypothetical protein